jgi:hypothetical protein
MNKISLEPKVATADVITEKETLKVGDVSIETEKTTAVIPKQTEAVVPSKSAPFKERQPCNWSIKPHAKGIEARSTYGEVFIGTQKEFSRRLRS